MVCFPSPRACGWGPRTRNFSARVGSIRRNWTPRRVRTCRCVPSPTARPRRWVRRRGVTVSGVRPRRFEVGSGKAERGSLRARRFAGWLQPFSEPLEVRARRLRRRQNQCRPEVAIHLQRWLLNPFGNRCKNGCKPRKKSRSRYAAGWFAIAPGGHDPPACGDGTLTPRRTTAGRGGSP